MPSKYSLYLKKLRKVLLYVTDWPIRYWRGGKIHKILSVIAIIVCLCILSAWSIAQYYAYTQRNIPLTYGATFIPDYAESLGLNPKQTMTALLNIGVRQFRLTSYWSDIQPTKGTYNFSMLDWEFNQANKYHAKIILTVGLRQPRWPECHPPNWINTSAKLSSWEPQLFTFMSKVINRYKNNPALEAWQLENEYFLKGFGDCTNYSRSRLVSEYALLQTLDPHHPIIVGRSNNALGFPIGKPQPDFFGISVYKRVWNTHFVQRYLEYPFPGWFYGFLAGTQKIYSGKNMIIDELQAEAWPPNGQSITTTPLKIQDESMNSTRLKNRFLYAKKTGMKDAILWGAEYWYYRKEILHDPGMWNVAKEEFKANDYHNGSYLFSHPNL